MRRLPLFLAILLVAALPAAAQSGADNERGTLGVFFDDTRIQFAPLNLYGIGGRVSANIKSHTALEGDLAYDFDRTKTDTFTLVTPLGGIVTSTASADIHVLHGLFGPKLQTTGPVRVFGELKAGFVHLGTNNGSATIVAFSGGTPATSIFDLSSSETHPALFPGGGVEFMKKRWGVRLEVGDEIFWRNGANHNLKIMAGPEIRF